MNLSDRVQKNLNNHKEQGTFYGGQKFQKERTRDNTFA
jgi:hypothetical protein